MIHNKPSIPSGTRDFSPTEMFKRNHIFTIIKSVFKKFGYQEIQTPSMENLSTLTGKYGEEGDRLIFKILNSGDFLAKVDSKNLQNKNLIAIAEGICTKALRYDLTVPFARYVMMHQHELTLPFKRFQIQPVWRADRPQKGRYREFYQCDADVVGSSSLLNEAELLLMYDEVLTALGLKDFTIEVNNRKILSGIAEFLGNPEAMLEMTIAVDKLEKIGLHMVCQELIAKGFTDLMIDKLKPLILFKGANNEKINTLRTTLRHSAIGLQGIQEIEQLFSYLDFWQWQRAKIELDITLARGLNYYTGSIFEVKINQLNIGSIGGGGRYDDLTSTFGFEGLTGVGISFGADRIYDVLEELDLFPATASQGTQILISNFDSQAERYALPLLQKLRTHHIPSEIYPSASKLKKQMSYAHGKKIPYVVLIGSDEIHSGLLTLKDMQSGTQQKISSEELIDKFVERLK